MASIWNRFFGYKAPPGAPRKPCIRRSARYLHRQVVRHTPICAFRNPFLNFLQEVRLQTTVGEPALLLRRTWNMVTLTKLAATMWNCMTDVQKRPYRHLALSSQRKPKPRVRRRNCAKCKRKKAKRERAN